jgi:hypothetical protein
VTIEGVVRVEAVATGSKSEQRTVTLHAADRVWLLRRQDGPKFGVDPVLEKLEGRRIRAEGYAGTAAFVAVRYDVIG